MNKTISLIAFTLVPLLTNAQWAPVNVGVTAILNSVNFSTSQKIIVAGAGRSVISNDGGSTWTQQIMTDTFGNTLGGNIYDMHYMGGNTYNMSGQFVSPNSQMNFRSTTNLSNMYWTFLTNAGPNPKITYDNDFANSTLGYSCGSNGVITKTTDGGLTWVQQNSLTSQTLKGIACVDPLTATAVGDLRILHTVNGGTTWTSQTVPYNLYSVHFPTPTIGYACGEPGVVLKSTDAGATWTPLPISNLLGSATLYEIFFTSQDTGYISTYGGILKTIDGGQIWTWFPLGNPLTILRSIHFLDANNGYAVGVNGEVFRTTNGGGPLQGFPISGFTVNQVASCGSTVLQLNNITGAGPGYTTQWFINGNPYSTSYSTSVTYTASANIVVQLVTTNTCCSDTTFMNVNVTVQQPNPVAAGVDQSYCGSAVQLSATGSGTFSWSPTAGLNNPNIAGPLASPTVTTTYTVSLTNGVCVSTDETVVTVLPIVNTDFWDPDTMPINPGDAARSVLFIDPNHGFAVQNGGIHKTVNGGATWTNSMLASFGNYSGRIAYTNYTNWFVASSTLRQTTDAGATWSVNPLNGITLTSGDDVFDVFFCDAMVGYILINNTFNYSTRVAKTINGGTTWSICYNGSNERMVSIYGVNSDTVFFTGCVVPTPNYIRAYKTYNGGTTWQSMPITAPSGTIAYEVEFLDASYGYVVGLNNLFQTNDGGNTWTSFPMTNVLTVEIINHDTVFAGVGNRIYKTYTAGQCWADMGVQTLNYVWDFCFPRRQYVVGYFGTASSIVGQRSVVEKTILTSAPYIEFTLADSICENDPFTAYNGSVGYQSYQWFVNNNPVSTVQDYASSLPQGVYQIMLVGTHTTGTDTLIQTLTVTGIATPTITLSNPTVCSSFAPIILSGGSPTGGVYSGPGVNNGMFNPSITGPGIFPITYTYGISSCAVSVIDSIQVLVAPTSSLLLADTILCYPQSAITLAGGSPAGGVYSGTAVNSGSFDPMISGPGSFQITYTTTNGNCNTASTDSIHVISTPSAALELNDSIVCQNVSQIALIGGTPFGGTYSGIAVSAGNFNPSVSGAGSFEITYTAANGICTATATDTIEVRTAPIVTLSLSTSSACESAIPISLSGGSPSGGIYSGPGVTSGSFDPVSTGIGSFPITYTITDSVCTVLSIDTIQVAAQTIATLSLLDSLTCLVPSSIVLSGGNPVGGIYSGPGVSGGTFDPMVTGPGTFAITYTVTEFPCPSSAAVDSITVDVCNVIEEIGISSILIYPNPFSGTFQLSNNMPESATFYVEDINGRIVSTGHVQANSITEVDLANNESGVYIIRFANELGNAILFQKLIKL